MEPNEKIESVAENIRMKNEQKELRMRHYYGDTIRILFICMAVIMLITTPFLKNQLPVPAFYSIFGVLVLSILAGFINPKSRSIIIFDFLVSIFALIIFGYQMVTSYNGFSLDLYFWTNVALSTMALFSLYFSSKTLRGNILY